MLKMPLNEIRGQIQIYPENWINLADTNCYAYALGLDIRDEDICPNAYQPGTISETIDWTKLPEYLSYNEFIMGLEKDLEKVAISYREIEPDEQIEPNLWKIALFTEIYEKDENDELITDFHFLRTNKNGIWLHKPGYFNPISDRDFDNKIITNPRECNLFCYEYKIFFEYKKCYALRLNKK